MKRKFSPKTDTFIDTYHNPLSTFYLVFSGETLTEILFEKPKSVMPAQTSKQSAIFKKQLDAYFSGLLKEFDQKIGFTEGTDFEKAVWLCLKEIPYGETRSYKWLAERIGRPKAVRAVGRALAQNPLPIVLPCHRVIESDGSLGGYSGGIDIKRRLLDIEYYALRAMNNEVAE